MKNTFIEETMKEFNEKFTQHAEYPELKVGWTVPFVDCPSKLIENFISQKLEEAVKMKEEEMLKEFDAFLPASKDSNKCFCGHTRKDHVRWTNECKNERSSRWVCTQDNCMYWTLCDLDIKSLQKEKKPVRDFIPLKGSSTEETIRCMPLIPRLKFNKEKEDSV